MKKFLSMLLALVMVLALAGCGGKDNTPAPSPEPSTTDQPQEGGDAAPAEDWHIGIITGTVSQSEDDLRGAEAIQAKYGKEKVKLATYPDNFTEET